MVRPGAGRQGQERVIQGHQRVRAFGDHVDGRMRRVRRAAVQVQGDSGSGFLAVVNGTWGATHQGRHSRQGVVWGREWRPCVLFWADGI